MQTHRAIFTLKGNNISLPSPYKLKKNNKMMTHLPDYSQQHSNEIRLIVKVKDSLPLRKLPSQSSNHQSTHPET